MGCSKFLLKLRQGLNSHHCLCNHTRHPHMFITTFLHLSTSVFSPLLLILLWGSITIMSHSIAFPTKERFPLGDGHLNKFSPHTITHFNLLHEFLGNIHLYEHS